MAYRHARGYRRLDDCMLIGCADIVRENAERFADEFDIDHVYEDYEEMVRQTQPDIVSVCVPPKVHAEIVTGCAESGAVNAIHCEKPMATTWADCKRMVEVCEERDVKLTIDHQRRFGTPYRKAKKLLDGGAIGELRRFEWSEDNIFDAGTHLFDLCGYYNDQTPPEWVLAGIDYREENVWFGAHNENQAFAQWKYENDVYGCASTGPGSPFVGCYLRIIGDDGVIELGAENGPPLRIKRDGSDWKTVDTDNETIYGRKTGIANAAIEKIAERLPTPVEDTLRHPSNYEKAIADVVRAVREDDESMISGENVLQSTELVFASWESARRRGRVDLPLDIDDNPLESMVEDGKLGVSSEST
ncbi:Gfo/Idh/MocA family protein [Halalkalicoccus salilacus]